MPDEPSRHRERAVADERLIIDRLDAQDRIANPVNAKPFSNAVAVRIEADIFLKQQDAAQCPAALAVHPLRVAARLGKAGGERIVTG
jgi:hypothetical protein